MLKLLLVFLATVLVAIEQVSGQCASGPFSDCVVYNGIRIKTFDGNLFNFDSACGYTLVSVPAQGLDIKYLKSPSSLRISYNNRVFLLTLTATGTITVTVDGLTVTVPQTQSGVSISKPGRLHIVKIAALGIKMRYDGDVVEVIQDNSLTPTLPLGICGNNNGCTFDDLILPDGQTAVDEVTWANAWSSPTCTATAWVNECDAVPLQLPAATLYCTDLFAMTIFGDCSLYGPVFMDQCTSNYCGCTAANRMDCMCDLLDAMIRTCEVDFQIIVSWRSPSVCPIACSILDQSYQRCAPDNKQLTCGEDPVTNPALYDCEEGCYCPAGERFYNNQCLLPSQCPCTYNGVVYAPGSTMMQDCNQCTCTNGKWDCETKRCSSNGNCNGDPHCHTFDGRRFDFMGKCTYYLVRGIGYDIMCDHYVWNGAAFVKNYQSNAAAYCSRIIIEVTGYTIELLQNKVVRVNGQTIPWFPFVVYDFSISKPSSEWVRVTLRNKVTVSFDGRWLNDVVLPSSQSGRVAGLLGNYDGNPANDFEQPDGTQAANANAFGHSWVVPGSCPSNANTDEPEHPCTTYPAKQAGAQAACAYINTLFAGCSDDPVTDYEACVYDGCNCPDGDARCLCDHYVLQAQMCAEQDPPVMIDWRATITECAITCPAGQVEQLCADSCASTCDDISLNTDCESTCVEGCNCPPGQTLNQEGVCVAISQCPCVYNGVRFPPGFAFVLLDLVQKYECENGVWVITDATPQDIIDYESPEDWESQCPANDFLTFAGCMNNNQETCLNQHLDIRPNYNNCQAGCQCTPGFVLNTQSGECVRPEDCPCGYNGVSYPNGAVVDNRDETCTCIAEMWECTAPPTNYWEMCSAWGNVHVRTFDETFFSFEGYCEYILFQYVFGTGVFRVTIETSSCNTGACLAAVYVHYRAENGNVENVIFLAGDDYVTSNDLLYLIVSDLEISVMVDVSGLGVRVIYDKVDNMVHIHVASNWLTWNNFGLCGQYDNIASNDLEVPGVTLNGVIDFVNYYKFDRTCGSATEMPLDDILIPDDPCNYLYSDVFATCRFLIPVQPYYNSCRRNIQQQLSLPVAQRTNHYCSVLAAYAQECNNVDQGVNWRTNDICPYACQGTKLHYICDTPCPRETCANTEGYDTLCQDRVCAESCNVGCPVGTIFLDATYTTCIAPGDCPVTGEGRRMRIIG